MRIYRGFERLILHISPESIENTGFYFCGNRKDFYFMNRYNGNITVFEENVDRRNGYELALA